MRYLGQLYRAVADGGGQHDADHADRGEAGRAAAPRLNHLWRENCFNRLMQM